MKTTLNLPDDLMRAVKLRAVEEDRTLTETIADLLRRGLAQEPSPAPTIRNRVQLPLVRGAHPARPDEEMTPERIAQILLDQEAEWSRDAVR
jgi:plasmid stability protein